MTTLITVARAALRIVNRIERRNDASAKTSDHASAEYDPPRIAPGRSEDEITPASAPMVRSPSTAIAGTAPRTEDH